MPQPGLTGTITTGASTNVLQWGGTALASMITAPSGVTATNNFIIGSGATLNLTGAAKSVLVSDLTGNPSQIFGTLNAGTLGGPLYVSNTNGVIVGNTGVITAPGAGIGLVGYAVDPIAFRAGNGTLAVNDATAGGGAVTIANGATLNGGPLLVASNGTVNIGAVSSAASPSSYVIAGFPFTTAVGSVVPTPGTGALSSGGSSVVNFTGPATLTVDQLVAAGAVNNAATLTLTDPAVSGISATTNFNVAGLFTNTGQVTETNNLSLNQLAGGLANLGTITEASPGGLTIMSTKGNVQNTGVLVLTGAGADLQIMAANIDLEGKVQIGTKAISTSNQLGTLFLSTTATPNPQSGGVVDVGASLFTSFVAAVEGNAIRIVSGGIFNSGGSIYLLPGTNAAGVSDPFYNLKSLNYTFSTFPGTMVQETAASGNIWVLNPNGSTLFSNSPGLNLNGPLSVTGTGSFILVGANNINSNNGLNGGFSVQNGGTIVLQFFGNVNNPSGGGSFLNNFVPVTVAPNGTKAGTVEITLAGPSANSATAQNVNLLVQGNVNLADGTGTIAAAGPPTFSVSTTPLTAPGPFPTAPISPYANNHLVVTATGNIGLDPSQVAGLTNPNIFYWPGLVWLTAGATASNPTAAPNSTASIALGDVGGVFTGGTSTTVSLNNILAADLTKASVSGSIGQGGVHYLASSLNLTPGTGTAGTTTISNNSWVNFLTPALATAFQITNPAQFTGGFIQTNGQVNAQQLPAADFQP